MKDQNENSQQKFDQEKLSKRGSLVFFFIQFSILIFCFIFILKNGLYGWTLFTFIPFSIGLTIGTYTRLSRNKSFLYGAIRTILIIIGLSLLLLAIGMEGAICILMALGLIALPALIGMLFGYVIRKIHRTYILVLILILNSSAYVYDKNDNNKIISTTSEKIIINTSKEKVWNILTHPVDFSPNNNLFFKAGVSFPQSMKIEFDEKKQCFLCCNFNNGYTKLKVDRLDSLKSIRFSFTEHAVPMKELTFYQSINADHLEEGYFLPEYGEFELVPVSSSQCELVARTAYSYKITPVFYWQWWADYLVNRMHKNVLIDLKMLSEKDK